MNDIDKNPNYKKIYNIVKNNFEKSRTLSIGNFDETYFTLRVFETAKEIMKCYKKCNRKAILVAALLHDIGKARLDFKKIFGKRKKLLKNAWQEIKKHPMLSKNIAKRILKSLGHSKEFINFVCFLIENHHNYGMKDKPLELKILQDADLVADRGLTGFVRFMIYSSFKGRSIIKTIERFNKRIKDTNFNKINLEVSKKILRKKLKKEQEMARLMLKKIESDLK